ncbi:MAG TPA: dihydroorotase [Candidatus Binataceae bacterium]|nr:dihydroorotase [Candidatus Binataceae bacterium]
MKRIMLLDGRLLDPRSKLDTDGNLLIESDRIVGLGRDLPVPADALKIDCHGLWVMPGLIDPHVHLRDPGFPEKETIRSGLRAAAAGGFTAVAAMANTAPVNDTPEITRYMLERAPAAEAARLVPVAAVTRGLRGRDLVDFPAMVQAGARMFSDDGLPLDDVGVLKQALEAAASAGFAVSLHEEDRALTVSGAMNAGAVAQALGVKGIPASAETERVGRDLAIARELGTPLHLAHVSTAGALDLITAARAAGVAVSCEVTPHHFILDDRTVLTCGADARMAPPLRSPLDRDRLRRGLADGSIDMIATDHAPHDPDSKQHSLLARHFPRSCAAAPLPDEAAHALATAANGIIGLETALGLALTLVHEGLITPLRLVELMSANPARLLRLDNLGTLAAGALADITVVDPKLEWTVNPEQFCSLSRNTPFAGWRLKGQAVLTIVAGRVVHDARRGSADAA